MPHLLRFAMAEIIAPNLHLSIATTFYQSVNLFKSFCCSDQCRVLPLESGDDNLFEQLRILKSFLPEPNYVGPWPRVPSRS